METILVVDDEEGVRSLVRDILEPRGYTILDTGDPRQALRIAREHPTPIDLFLIDVLMPLMKGTELALKVEALRPQAKILLMSVYMLSEVTATGRPFLAKPFSLNGRRAGWSLALWAAEPGPTPLVTMSGRPDSAGRRPGGFATIGPQPCRVLGAG